MFLIAIILILSGLAILAGIFFVTSVKKQEIEGEVPAFQKSETVNESVPVSKPENLTVPPVKETEPMEILESKDTEPLLQQKRPILSGLIPDPLPLEQKETLKESLKVLEKTRVKPVESYEESVAIEGILFMDQNAGVRERAGKLDSAPPSFFVEWKRVGPGNMIVQGSRFTIQCGKASFSYGASDLTEILFLKKGMALIPSDGSPAPVFITEHAGKVKSYIKRHARIEERA